MGKSITDHWKGQALHDLPTATLIQLANGTIGKDSNLRRRNAADVLQARKRRMESLYIKCCDSLSLVYDQLFRSITTEEAQHLGTIFSRNELRVIHDFLNGSCDFGSAVELMRQTGLSSDGVAKWDLVNLLDLFGIEAMRLWPWYIGKAEEKFGLQISFGEIPISTREELARRNKLASKNPAHISKHAEVRSIPIPERRSKTVEEHKDTPRRKIAKRNIPMPDWFKKYANNRKVDAKEPLWLAVQFMNDVGSFHLSSLGIPPQEAKALTNELLEKKLAVYLGNGWYRLSACHFFLSKLGRTEIKKEASVMETPGQHYPPIPAELQEYFLKLFEGVSRAGVISKSKSGWKEDDPKLKKLEELGVVSFTGSSYQYRFKSPYSLLGQSVGRKSMNLKEVAELCCPGYQAAGDESTIPEPVPAPQEESAPSAEQGQSSAEAPEASTEERLEQPSMMDSDQVKEVPSVATEPESNPLNFLLYQEDELVGPVSAQVANFMLQLQPEGLTCELAEDSVEIATKNFKIIIKPS